MEPTPRALSELVETICVKAKISKMEARGIVNQLVKAMKEIEYLCSCARCGSYMLCRDVGGRIVCEMCQYVH